MSAAHDVLASLSHSWRAMGCRADVMVVGGNPSHLDLAQRTVDRLERHWSRFLASTDISIVNASAGSWVLVHPRTIELITAMMQGHAITDGAFDPTLLAPLVGLGYAASWDRPERVTSIAAGVHAQGRPAEIELDVGANRVKVPLGTVLDAGGIGKGLAADIAVAELIASGAAGALVSIGGDLRAAGTPSVPWGWQIAIEAPDGAEQARLALAHGGVATSGTAHRAWTSPDGSPVHHLLDPATRRPVLTGERSVVEVSVVAGTAAWAEVFTKAVMVRGAAEMLPRLDRIGLGARVVFGDGGVQTNSAWNALEAVVLDADVPA